jgi:hypothetical protein
MTDNESTSLTRKDSASRSFVQLLTGTVFCFTLAAGCDYLYLNSSPAPAAVVGTEFKYQVQCTSHSNLAGFGLEDAPAGMTITDGGLVHWKIPRDIPNSLQTFVVRVQNQTGFVTRQRFVIELAEASTQISP